MKIKSFLYCTLFLLLLPLYPFILPFAGCNRPAPLKYLFSLAMLLVLVIPQSAQSDGRADSIGVFIPRDEDSPVRGPQKFMWVDLKNIVISTQIGNSEFLEVWTDNGHADQPDYYSPDYCSVTPAFEGEINVYTIQRIQREGNWDTITTTNTFFAVSQPEIRLMPLSDQLADSCKLYFFLADKYKYKPLSTRYKVARSFEPYVFNEKFELVGKLPASTSDEIDCSKEGLPFEIKKGYKIVVQVLVRDTETDLLITADEWVYIVP